MNPRCGVPTKLSVVHQSRKKDNVTRVKRRPARRTEEKHPVAKKEGKKKKKKKRQLVPIRFFLCIACQRLWRRPLLKLLAANPSCVTRLEMYYRDRGDIPLCHRRRRFNGAFGLFSDEAAAAATPFVNTRNKVSSRDATCERCTLLPFKFSGVLQLLSASKHQHRGWWFPFLFFRVSRFMFSVAEFPTRSIPTVLRQHVPMQERVANIHRATPFGDFFIRINVRAFCSH